MASFCLTKQAVESFKRALKNRELDPFAMADMTSDQRRNLLTKYVGEHAQDVNALFESKLLLKNQKAGYQTWAKKVSGISPEVRRDLISRIQRLDKILSPAQEKEFLQDLASARLGVEVTLEEANKISQLSDRVSELESKTDKSKSDVELGRAKLDLTDYVNELGGRKADLLTNIAGVPRSLMSSLDLSAPLNQGWGMLSRKNFYVALAKMFKYAASKNSFRDLQAEIVTHPNYDKAKKAGLRITDLGDKLEMREEQFMTTLLDKVPGISGSQRAYAGFLNKLRMDSFNDLLNKAEVAGEDVTAGSQATKDLASAVNDFTGGARVGKIEGAVPFLNSVFFSPRKITSTLRMLNPRNYVDPKLSKTARLERTRNMIGSVALTMAVIALYSALTGDEQEADPTSTDFGKIRSGDTRIDLSGGNAGYVTLLSRLATGKMKGGSGISRELGTAVADTSAAQLIGQFLRYKLSPNASLLIDAVTGANAIGEKKTITESVTDRFKPMFASSVVELLKSDTDGKFAFALAGLLGAGLNTYELKTDWEQSTSKELTQFKAKVGEDRFKKANEIFDTRYNQWYENIKEKDAFKRLSDDDKGKLITKSKKAIKARIFKKYGFKYKQSKSKDNLKSLMPK